VLSEGFVEEEMKQQVLFDLYYLMTRRYNDFPVKVYKHYFINNCVFFSFLCYRSMHFLSCFLHEFGQGDKSVEDAMNKSYGQTLKRYHGWITRGLFSVIIIFNSF